METDITFLNTPEDSDIDIAHFKTWIAEDIENRARADDEKYERILTREQ